MQLQGDTDLEHGWNAMAETVQYGVTVKTGIDYPIECPCSFSLMTTLDLGMWKLRFYRDPSRYNPSIRLFNSWEGKSTVVA